MDAIWVHDHQVAGLPLRKCGTCGASVMNGDALQHENFHKVFSNRKDQTVSKVSWCDYGDHAFKTGEEGSASFSGTEVIDGAVRNTDMDACKDHNPLNVARDAAKYGVDKATLREITTETVSPDYI